MNEENKALVANEDLELEKRQQELIEGMIGQVLLYQPELKDRLSAQSVRSFMRLPDSSFGWIEKTDKMPQEVKIMLVVTHIKLGATPGFGHIFWLGNGMYCSASFLRNKASQDRNWLVTKADFEPFTIEERQSFGLEETDLCLKVIQDISYHGSKFTAVGHGIIGLDEVKNAHPKNKSFQTKKNLAMMLKTRAERDLLRRYYPIELPDVDESERKEIVIDVEQTKLLEDDTMAKEREHDKHVHAVQDAHREFLKVFHLKSVETSDYPGILKSIQMKNPQEIYDNGDLELVKRLIEFVEEYSVPIIEKVPDHIARSDDSSNTYVDSPSQPTDQQELQLDEQELDIDMVTEREKIKKLLNYPDYQNNKKISDILSQFKKKRIEIGDSSLILTGLVKATQTGNFKELESLLQARADI